jgi:hypothetical protein
MVRVLIEVWNKATASSVVAQARSVREAARIAATIYPSAKVRVKLPILRLSSLGTLLLEPGIVSVERAEGMTA